MAYLGVLRRVCAISKNIHRFINGNNLGFNESEKLRALKKILDAELHDPKSNLSIYLSTLSNDDKSKLIAALIKNDRSAIIDYLCVKGPFKNDTALIAEMAMYDSELNENDWLNDICRKMIKIILDQANSLNTQVDGHHRAKVVGLLKRNSGVLVK